jgi:tetratricopeptide (TPR) repeat protein/predicted Ser/Thr protein kinase
MPKPERGRAQDDQQTIAGGTAARAPGESSSSGTNSPSDAPTLLDGSQTSPVSPVLPPSTPVPRKSPPEASRGPQLLQPQRILGERYQILELLGQGGMGAVYKARDLEVNQLVALKVIRPELASNPAIIERFKRELILARQVTHKNVIRIYDLAEAEGVKFITMEYIGGESLTHVLEKRGKLPAQEAAEMMEKVCLALEAAHSEGVVHRDLKPGNIMLDNQGRVLVMDFGLARSVELPESESGNNTLDELRAATHVDAYRSVPGSLVGTPHYMSPEQARREPVDARSDLYAVGLIFYELVIGQRPFPSDDPVTTLLKRTQENPKSLVEIDPTTPRPLSNIVGKCLERDRRARYQTARDILNDLEKWLRPAARRTWVWASAASALLALVVIQFWVQQKLSVKPAAHAPVSLLVSDFKNETGDSVFDGTMEPAFSVAMEGAPFITSFNRGQAHKLVAQVQPGATALDEQLARLVATREGISTVIGGSISGNSDAYRLTVRAVDGVTGKIIATASEHADKKDVLVALGRLAAKIRKALGDKTPESVQLAAAETFTTRSLEAAHEFGLAQDAQLTGRWDDAIEHDLKALQIDPDLGRAYASLGSVYYNIGQVQQAENYYQKALSKLDRMSDREKYRTRGAYYVLTRDTDKAIEEQQQLVKLYPADTAGMANLAFAYFFRRDMAKALEVSRQGIAIYPNNVVQRGNVGLYAMYAGDFDTAIAEQRKVLEMSPSFVKGYVGTALPQLAQGHPDQAAETYKQLEKVSPRAASVAAEGLADIALYKGFAAEAIAILEKSIPADLAAKNADAASIKLSMLSEAQLLAGKPSEATASAEKALAQSKEDNVTFWAARAYLGAKDETKALSLARQLASRLTVDAKAYAKIIEGEVHLARGKPQDALELFLESRKFADTWMGRFDAARAYLEAGAFAQADSELEVCMKRRGEATALFLDDAPTYHLFPPVYYYLGRAQQGLKSPAAAESYKTFISMKSGQDPLIADARRRLGSP